MAATFASAASTGLAGSSAAGLLGSAVGGTGMGGGKGDTGLGKAATTFGATGADSHGRAFAMYTAANAAAAASTAMIATFLPDPFDSNAVIPAWLGGRSTSDGEPKSIRSGAANLAALAGASAAASRT